MGNPEDFFERRIRPVLVKHCYKCHGVDADRRKGGLLLATRDGLLRGGDSGPAIDPGSPEGSLLIQALRHEDKDLAMPPKGKLPDTVIADFETWVKIGAPDPRRPGVSGTTAEPTTPTPGWAFTPPRNDGPPEVENEAWPRGEIDRFIIAKLEAKGLDPAPEADRRTLIRRLHYALIGLPPTPEEIEAFVGDDSPSALATLVDRLLDSPHFGERWGRHWLDVARYSDSTGGGRTRALVNAWRYRDYVIDAFNSDKPFDRFIREQIAGDLLDSTSEAERRDALVATAFLVLGPHNYENQDKDLLRMDVVDEQISTTCSAFLGLTLGCSRCHDHKFDPIPTRDYYALAGIFRSTKTLTPGNVAGFVERPLPVSDDMDARIAKHSAETKRLEKELGVVKARLKKLGGKPKSKAARLPTLVGIVVDDVKAEQIGFWKKSTFHPAYVDAGYIHDDGKEKGRKSVVFTPPIPQTGIYEVRLAYASGSNRATNTPVTIRHADGEKTMRIDQRKAPPIGGLLISLGPFRFEKGAGGSVTVSNAETDGVVIADAVELLSPALAAAKTETRAEKRQQTTGDDDDAKLAQEREKLEAKRKSLQKRAAALRAKAPPRPKAISVEEETKTGDWHVHVRGEIRNLGPKVPRGFLSALGARTPPEIPDGSSGRMELAEWIASESNALTSRVIVNRAWHWLFGRGIVPSTDNFGSTGEEPSHRDLLDWLARRFVAGGWSIKRLVREIVLSRTYGQSTRQSSRARQVDPENRLLSHAHRIRMDAESLRDSILSVSGRLDLTAGGPSIRSASGKMAGNKVEYGYRYSSRRRSVYVPIFRNSLHELFDVFDFADPNFVVGRRPMTTRATQALYLLNGPFLHRQCEHAAKRLLATDGVATGGAPENDAPGNDVSRVEHAFLRTLGRPPSAAESRLALEFVAAPTGEDTEEARVHRWAGLFKTLVSCVDFRFLE